jgi:hypothetical protein
MSKSSNTPIEKQPSTIDGWTTRTPCYSCPGQIEEGLADLGSPQCQDCRDERRPINPERFLAVSGGVVDGIDMVAIARQRRNARTPGAELDDMSWAA